VGRAPGPTETHADRRPRRGGRSLSRSDPGRSLDAWDPRQYDRFRDQRRQPFFDLLDLLRPIAGGRAVDLGCGTGELTAALHRRLGARETIGIDRSAAMLADCQQWAGDGTRFERRDIADFPAPDGGDGTFDVIAANASFQWVDDHVALLARLRGALAPGGQLAFQVPANFDHPSHTLATSLAAEAPYAAALAGNATSRGREVLAPEAYAAVLHQLGFDEQVVRLQVYGHLLDSTEDVVEWVKGTTLTPYREHLDEPVYEEFVATYRTRLIAALGAQHPYFYPFKRILCWARLG
jgi:trans-aconitate 2-methyltransferase